MKTTLTRTLIAGVLTATFVIISCQKSKISDFPASKSVSTEEVTGAHTPGTLLENGSVLSGGVTLTAPQEVNVNETFDITAAIDCGKVAIERGYIFASDGVTKIYKDLSCSTVGLKWEGSDDNFECYTVDASWNGSFAEPGSYVFRTKHNGSDGNCDGKGGQDRTGACTFNGNEFYCFVIEAVDACETSFTGEAIYCGTSREAVFTFKSKDAYDYIKIQGGLTDFTGADATVYINGTVVDFNTISADGWAQGTANEYTVGQRTPGGSSNRNIRVEGGLAECDELVIRIVWPSSNAGGVITGSWSVKDSNGVEIAPAVAGLTCN